MFPLIFSIYSPMKTTKHGHIWVMVDSPGSGSTISPTCRKITLVLRTGALKSGTLKSNKHHGLRSGELDFVWQNRTQRDFWDSSQKLPLLFFYLSLNQDPYKYFGGQVMVSPAKNVMKCRFFSPRIVDSTESRQSEPQVRVILQ